MSIMRKLLERNHLKTLDFFPLQDNVLRERPPGVEIFYNLTEECYLTVVTSLCDRESNEYHDQDGYKSHESNKMCQVK